MRLLPSREDWTPYVWTVYVAFFLMTPFLRSRTTALEWTLTAATTVVFLALYFRGFWVDGRRIYAIIIAITLLGAVWMPFNAGAGAFFIYAAGFAHVVGRTREAVRVIIVLELLLVLEVWLANVHPFAAFWPIFFTPVIGAINVHYANVQRSNSRLRLAQDEIERLAKVAERERIARDLHDVVGHTLSLIVLKSELASKLAERDPDRARAEIRDVERISREALAEVRQAISGYRAGWKSELESAEAMMRTAGVEVVQSTDPVKLSALQEAVLSMCLREAATNVVRHSGARRCAIDLKGDGKAITLTVADNGRGGTDREGFGLTGMRERVTALGGSVTRRGDSGTTITVTLPISQSTAMERSA
jgi:two-component system, NarL family, sensor histidine kinase DesK